jgi:hypothetical protein
MCDEVVGSEKVVDYRRQFFNVLDDVYNHRGNNNCQIISSGSKAEGLNLPGSDLDVMHVNKKIHVYEFDDILSNYQDLRTERNLVLDFEKHGPFITLLLVFVTHFHVLFDIKVSLSFISMNCLFHSRTSYIRSRVKPGIALSKSKTKLRSVLKS